MFEELRGVGVDDLMGFAYGGECVEDVQATRFAEVASDEDAHAYELCVCHLQFFDEEVMSEDVNVFVVDDAPDHFVGAKDEDVGVGGVDGVDESLLLERDACDLGFSAALDERDSKDLTERLGLVKVLWFEIYGAEFFLFKLDLFFESRELFGRDMAREEEFAVL